MSGPIYSGGGRRQRSSIGWRRIGRFGRVLLALAAGAAFGLLAWEPPTQNDSEDARSASKSRQPDRVKEDATGLQLSTPGEPADVQRQIGWLRKGGREDGVPDRSGLPREAQQGNTNVVTRTHQNERSDEVPTSSLHSRGPPSLR